VERLKKVAISGPFPFWDGSLYLPSPGDSYAVREGNNMKGYPLRPLLFRNNEGCNLPPGLVPSVPAWRAEDVETETFPPYWSLDKLSYWLSQPAGEDFIVSSWNSEEGQYPEGFMGLPLKDERTHVQIDPVTGASEEGILFSTTGLDFTRTELAEEPDPFLSMALRVNTDDEVFLKTLNGLNALNSLGGERRLAFWKHDPSGISWACPGLIRECLRSSGGRIRMQMATPGIFNGGWKPGWIGSEPDLRGTIPGTDIEVRLVSAVVRRWQPLAGWSYEKGKRGPKPIRRLVPAGSVYFFEVIKGNVDFLCDLWLKSVCDGEQDRLDGYGLALWGSWQ
jgi:CRISPR-associated protein Cmr3